MQTSPHHATYPAAVNENAPTFSPHLVEFPQEGLIVGNLAKLAVLFPVLLQDPVWRRGYDQVTRLVWQP